MNTRLSVAEAMDAEPLILGGDEPVASAARAMRERGVGSFLVYRDGRLEGICTERDLVRKVVAEGRDAAETTVAEIMSRDPITIASDDDILHALRIMRQHRIRRLPVIDRGELVGLVTERAISELAPELIQIAGDWDTIQKETASNGYRSILDEDEEATLARCDACGNVTEDIIAVEGENLCEDCRETIDVSEGPSPEAATT